MGVKLLYFTDSLTLFANLHSKIQFPLNTQLNWIPASNAANFIISTSIFTFSLTKQHFWSIIYFVVILFVVENGRQVFNIHLLGFIVTLDNYDTNFFECFCFHTNFILLQRMFCSLFENSMVKMAVDSILHYKYMKN